MKKLLFIFSLCLFGCNDRKDTPLSVADSLKIDSEAKAAIYGVKPLSGADSIESQKAIGNIRFGISQQEYKEQEKLFMKTCLFKLDKAYGLNEYRIGGYSFRTLTPSFFHEKLYKLTITGEIVHYEYYDTKTNEQAIAITKVFIEKYGPPDVNNGLIAWYKTQRNKWYQLVHWEIGKKGISIMMSNEGEYNTVDINIVRKDVQSTVDQIEQEQKDSTANAAKSKI